VTDNHNEFSKAERK